jgi:signal transduction histidine kinase
MTPDVLARVFRPFFSTKPAGSGLGLPTARKIIEAHGGTLDVQSEVGHGTKFTVALPGLAE